MEQTVNMDRNNRLGQNIKALLKALGETQDSFADKMEISKAELSGIINGKKKPKKETVTKIASYFGLSPETLLYEDFTGIAIDIDPLISLQHIDSLLPLFSSEEAEKNLVFAKAYESHRKIYDSQKTLSGIEENDFERVFTDCYDCYGNLSAQGLPEESWANAMAFWVYIIIYSCVIDTISKYVFHEKEYPAFFEYAKKNNRKFRKIVEDIEFSNDLEDKELVEEFKKDPGAQKDTYTTLRFLKRSKTWSDLADYYLCLLYLYGAVDNPFSAEQNHDFGYDLLNRLKKLGNKYAKEYIRIMTI